MSEEWKASMQLPGEPLSDLRRIRKSLEWLAWLLFAWTALILSPTQCGRDDTDPPGGYWHRSGMRLYRDAGTGCEYLASPLATTLTPRLGPDGKPLCRPRSAP